MASKLFQEIGPEKGKFSQGVMAIDLLKTGEFIVGAGDGTVQIVHRVVKQEKRKVTAEFVKVQYVLCLACVHARAGVGAFSGGRIRKGISGWKLENDINTEFSFENVNF